MLEMTNALGKTPLRLKGLGQLARFLIARTAEVPRDYVDGISKWTIDVAERSAASVAEKDGCVWRLGGDSERQRTENFASPTNLLDSKDG